MYREIFLLKVILSIPPGPLIYHLKRIGISIFRSSCTMGHRGKLNISLWAIVLSLFIRHGPLRAVLLCIKRSITVY